MRKSNLLLFVDHFHGKVMLTFSNKLEAETTISLLLEQSAEEGIIDDFARRVVVFGKSTRSRSADECLYLSKSNI